MATLSQSKVYSRFFSKVRAYDLTDLSVSDDEKMEMLRNWLYSAIAEPYIIRLFSTVSMDEDDDSITYTLENSEDDFKDELFIIEVLSYAMILSWLEPQIATTELTAQLLGTSNEKFYSQANHLNELRALRDDIESKTRCLIRDRGYINNDYINGLASSAGMREVDSSS